MSCLTKSLYRVLRNRLPSFIPYSHSEEERPLINIFSQASLNARRQVYRAIDGTFALNFPGFGVLFFNNNEFRMGLKNVTTDKHHLHVWLKDEVTSEKTPEKRSTKKVDEGLLLVRASCPQSSKTYLMLTTLSYQQRSLRNLRGSQVSMFLGITTILTLIVV